MGLATYSIYKYVRTTKGWRYCKPVYGKNNKLKPGAVLVGGREEAHPEGAYYLNVDGRWEKCGKSATEAQEERTRRLARQRYTRETGERLPEREPKGELLTNAIDAYLAELELKVAGKSRRPKTLAASRQALNEFASQSGIKYASEVSASSVAKHMAWCIANSRTQSSRTAANKFVLILQFLKHAGLVPTVGTGKSARPLGLRDTPRYTEKPVENYTDGELARFFFACDERENAIFQTLARAGLREQELATLRRADCVLGTDAPCLRITERPEYDFVPKWYQIRDVFIDPGLAAILKAWLGTHDHALVFHTPKPNGTLERPGNGVDGHILRSCKTVAKRAGMDPKRFWLHKFRATYATRCLREGMDLETLRKQLGHRDVESLRRYLEALKSEERAKKVAEIFSAWRAVNEPACHAPAA
jgi:integrase